MQVCIGEYLKDQQGEVIFFFSEPGTNYMFVLKTKQGMQFKAKGGGSTTSLALRHYYQKLLLVLVTPNGDF